MPGTPRPIRLTLTVNTLIIILLLSSAIMISMIIGTRTAVTTLSRVIMEQTFVQSANAIDSFLAPIEKELKLSAARANAGLIGPDDPRGFLYQLSPFLEQSDIVTSVLMTDSKDRHWLLDKKTGVVRAQAVDKESLRLFFDRIHTENINDRLKNWQVAWLNQHKLIDPDEYDFSAISQFADPQGSPVLLVFNLQLKAISRQIEKIRPLGKGSAVIVTPDNLLIGLPSPFHLTLLPGVDPEKETPTLEQWPLGQKILLKADNPEKNAKKKLLRQKINGTTWWMAGQSLVDESGNPFHIITVLPEHLLIGALLEQRTWIIAFTLMALVLGILSIKVLARRYSSPIETLVDQSRHISQGNLEEPEEIETDVLEVKELAQAHSHMRSGLRSLMRLERDLQLARQIQQKSMPHHLPQVEGFDLAAWNAPADQTGGDTFDVVGLNCDEKCGIDFTTDTAQKAILLLADATGHGMGPALSVTQLRAMLRMGCHITPEITGWARHINEQLHDDLPAGRFITAFLGEVDSREKTLTYFSAGQGPLLYFEKNKNKVTSLPADTYPLGIMEEMEIGVNRIPLLPGDIFAVISDGIYEAANPAREQMGEDRVRKLILDSQDLPAEEILDRIHSATERFTEGEPPRDDRTILIIKRV